MPEEEKTQRKDPPGAKGISSSALGRKNTQATEQARQVFLLASGNLEGLKVSKARNTKNCGTDCRIIGDAHNYGKKRLVGAVEACGPA